MAEATARTIVEKIEFEEAVARLEGLTHRYGHVCALDAVSLEIPAGCIVGLIGPDGVGKSSLLGIIAGAKRIQTGSVEVLGADMSDPRHRAAVCPRIAYMPQGLGKNLYADLSVKENIEFFGRLFGQDRCERDARIAELLGEYRLDAVRRACRPEICPEACVRSSASAARLFTIPIS